MMKEPAKPRNHSPRDLALIYIRESYHRLGDPDESPERQLARCIRLCQDRGWRYEVFQEPPGHRSGKREAGRPRWKDLKAKIKQPEVVAVVVSRLDRASRSLEDFSNFLKYLGQSEVEFVSVKENFDTTSTMGKAFLRIILILLELESDVDAERALEMISFKKEKGLTWGTIPFGYDRKQNLLTICEDGVKKDKRLLRDTEALTIALEGYGRGDLSYQGAARKLNSLGYRMRDRLGKRHLFTHKNIRVFVENAMLYAGYVPFGASWKRGQHPPIIPLELAERIEAMRVKRKVGSAGRRASRPYALSGILFCGNCGSKLLGAGPIWGKYYYRHAAGGHLPRVCKPGWTQVEATLMEDQVRELIRKLQIPKEADSIIRNLARARAEMRAGGESKKASDNVQQLEDQLKRAKRLYVVGDYSEDQYEKEKEAIERLITQESRKIAPPAYDADELIEKIRRAGAIIADTTDPTRFKYAVSMLFERLEIMRQEDASWKLSKVIPKEEFKEFF